MSLYDTIQKKLTSILTKELLPKLAEAATEIALNLGDEPPAKESINLLFQDAFRKVLDSPKTTTKSPKAAAKKKEPKVTKPQKSKWIDLSEMKKQLEESDGTKYYCGFVADRGPNKRKFCGVQLVGINCGSMSDDKEWTPHTPEQESEQVDTFRDMRCKNCWAVGKSGSYRKPGGFMKFYSDELVDSEPEPEPELTEEQIARKEALKQKKKEEKLEAKREAKRQEKEEDKISLERNADIAELIRKGDHDGAHDLIIKRQDDTPDDRILNKLFHENSELMISKEFSAGPTYTPDSPTYNPYPEDNNTFDQVPVDPSGSDDEF